MKLGDMQVGYVYGNADAIDRFTPLEVERMTKEMLADHERGERPLQ